MDLNPSQIPRRNNSMRRYSEKPFNRFLLARIKSSMSRKMIPAIEYFPSDGFSVKERKENKVLALKIKVNPKNNKRKNTSITRSKTMVPRDLSAGTFSIL